MNISRSDVRQGTKALLQLKLALQRANQLKTVTGRSLLASGLTWSDMVCASALVLDSRAGKKAERLEVEMTELKAGNATRARLILNFLKGQNCSSISSPCSEERGTRSSRLLSCGLLAILRYTFAMLVANPRRSNA